MRERGQQNHADFANDLLAANTTLANQSVVFADQSVSESYTQNDTVPDTASRESAVRRPPCAPSGAAPVVLIAEGDPLIEEDVCTVRRGQSHSQYMQGLWKWQVHEYLAWQ